MVPNRLKIKIVNVEYVNLNKLVANLDGGDSKDDIYYFSKKESNFTLASKSKANAKNIYTCTDIKV